MFTFLFFLISQLISGAVMIWIFIKINEGINNEKLTKSDKKAMYKKTLPILVAIGILFKYIL